MGRALTVIAFLLVLITLPLYLMVAGFSPMLTGGMTAQTPLIKKLLGNAIVAVILAVPLWVGFFGWRAIKAWGSGGSAGAAIATALPATALIAMFLYISFMSVAP